MNDLIIEIWQTLKPHLSSTDKADAAQDFIALLVDHDIVDEELIDIASQDSMLKKAAAAYVKEEVNFDETYDEDDYSYDDEDD